MKISMFRKTKYRRAATRRRSALAVTELESRQLLATGFLQGTVYHDLNANNAIDAGEAVAGAKVELFDAAGTTSLGVPTTDANGYYLFDNLTPGDYTLVEQPGGGYVGQLAQALRRRSTPILSVGPGASTKSG